MSRTATKVFVLEGRSRGQDEKCFEERSQGGAPERRGVEQSRIENECTYWSLLLSGPVRRGLQVP